MRVIILESCVQTTPTFPKDQTKFLISTKVSLNQHARVIFDVTLSFMKCWRVIVV